MEMGRVQRKLEILEEGIGLVFGALNKGGLRRVDELIHVLAQIRLRAVGLQRGRVCDKLGVLVGRIRKQCGSIQNT